jgi:hypothetical protein
MAELAIQVPEHHRAGFVDVALHADLRDARGDLLVARPRHGEAGDVALDVGEEHRHAEAGEALRHHHQRDRLAGAGRARDQAVAVAVLRQQLHGQLALADEDLRHARAPRTGPQFEYKIESSVNTAAFLRLCRRCDAATLAGLRVEERSR